MKRILQWYLNLKLRSKLLLSYLLVILLTMGLVGGTGYVVTRSFMERNALATSQVWTQQVAVSFQAAMLNVEQNLFEKSVNSPFINFQFAAKDETGDAFSKNRQKYQRAIEYLLHTESYYRFVYYSDLQASQVYVQAEGFAPGGLPYAQLLPEDALEEESLRLRALWGNSEWSAADGDLLLLKRAVYSINTLKYLGHLVVGIDASHLRGVFSGVSAAGVGDVVVLGNEGLPLYWQGAEGQDYTTLMPQLYQMAGKKPSGTLRLTNEGDNYIASFARTQDGRFLVVNLISVQNLMQDFLTLQRWTLLAFALAFGVSILFGMVITRNITRNVQLLLERMNALSEGDFASVLVPESQDEIGQLAGNFNEMSGRIQQLMDDVREESTRTQQAEYQVLEFRYNALQAQLNPHFLYNVLDSINSLAKLKNEDEICDIIQLLSQLLRESINQQEKFVPLRQEISYTQKYTQLYQMMYGDKLDFVYRIDPGTEDLPVPNFVLQPLVENAILHGIENKAGPGTVCISAWLEDGYLALEVADDGVGMDAGTLRRVLAGNNDKTHVGLYSVIERMRILYGEEYSPEIESNPGGGTLIRIWSPPAAEEG